MRYKWMITPQYNTFGLFERMDILTLLDLDTLRYYGREIYEMPITELAQVAGDMRRRLEADAL